MSRLVFRLLNHKDLTGRLAYADELLQEYKRVVNEIEGICMGAVHSEEDDKEAMQKNLAWLDDKRKKYGAFAEYESEADSEKVVPEKAVVRKVTSVQLSPSKKVVPAKDEVDEPVPEEFLTAQGDVTEADVRKALADFADEFGDEKAIIRAVKKQNKQSKQAIFTKRNSSQLRNLKNYMAKNI